MRIATTQGLPAKQPRLTNILNFNIPPQLRRQLERVAKREQLPLGAVIRHAIAQYIEQQEQQP